jgi:hypothetical protein
LVAGSSGLGGEEITEEFKAEVKALLPISADGSIQQYQFNSGESTCAEIADDDDFSVLPAPTPSRASPPAADQAELLDVSPGVGSDKIHWEIPTA